MQSEAEQQKQHSISESERDYRRDREPSPTSSDEMPSVEPTSQVNEQSQSSSHQENASVNNGQSEQQQHQEPNQQSTSNGEVRDPDRQLIPADRIEHVEDSAAPVDLPSVREFTQNDKINKFLLNSFLQRLNETDLSQFRGNGDAADGEDQEQDFEA